MKTDSDKPRFFWGWYIVAGAFGLMALSYGVRYSFGIFVQPLSVENGWSRSQVSLAATLNLLVYAIGGVGSGRLLDRFAPRWVASAGAVACTAGLFLCAVARTPWEFYAAYGLLYGLGSSWMGTVTTGSSVGKWFVRKRGLAIGLSSAGVSFGTLTLSPIAAFLLTHFSTRETFFFFSAGLLVPGMVIAHLLLRRTVPEAYGLAPDGDPPAGAAAEASSRADFNRPRPQAPEGRVDHRFWLLALCHGTSVLAAMMAFVHQVPYAIDRGIPQVTAAASLGAMGFAGLLGQFFFGWFSDRVGDPKYAAAAGYLCMAAGALLLLETHTRGMLLAYALVFGFGYGCLGPLLPIIAAHRFGRQNIGRIFGWLTFFVVGIGGSLGPIAGGILYDLTGSYRSAWWLILGLLIAAAAGILCLRRHAARAALPLRRA